MESNRLKKTPIASTYGNLAAEACSMTFAATPVGEHDFFELPPGAELVEVGIANAALGGSTTMSYGYRYKDAANGAAAPAAIRAAAASTAAASANVVLLDPLVFDVPVIITGTLAGAAGTGKVTVVPKYIYRGTK